MKIRKTGCRRTAVLTSALSRALILSPRHVADREVGGVRAVLARVPRLDRTADPATFMIHGDGQGQTRRYGRSGT